MSPSTLLPRAPRGGLFAALLTVLLALPAPALQVDVDPAQELLDQARWEEAREELSRRLAADPDDTFARIGLLRVRIGQGETVGVLEECDRLAAQGVWETELAYPRGLALHAMVRRSIDEGTSGALTASWLEDSYRQLDRALESFPRRFGDAWLPMAEAAWYSQALDTADRAADMAMRHDRLDPDVYLVWGRIRFSLYAVAVAEERDEERIEELWQSTQRLFSLALELLIGTGRDADTAEARLQLGHLHSWKQELDQAQVHYREALVSDPGRVDLQVLRNTLGAERLVAAIEGALPGFVKAHGDEDPRRATLLWWLGYARLELERHAGAEEAFRAARELWPEYRDVDYYLYRCALGRGELEAAVSALERLRAEAPDVFQQLVGEAERERVRALPPGDDPALARLRELTGA